MEINKIHITDALSGLKQLKAESINCLVTSPPYWALRDYGVKGQLGLEKTYTEYLEKLLAIFDEVKRVLKNDGTVWINIADTYGGSNCGYGQTESSSGFQNVKKQKYYATSNGKPIAAKVFPKSLIGIPFRFATEMINRGWILRNTIIWHKSNAMPESATDRFTNDFEYLFFFSKSRKYYFQQQFEELKSSSKIRAKYAVNSKKVKSGNYKGATNESLAKYYDKIKSGECKGRNMRATWQIATKSFKGAHFAVFPESLIDTPIKAGCPENGVVLDPFMGSGTTAVVAQKYNRNYIGFELNPEYTLIANKRIGNSNATSKTDIEILALEIELELLGI